MGKGLCIIDMQYGFEAAKNPVTIWNIIREIKKAKAQNHPIINVTLNPTGNGKVSPIIMDYLKKYKNVFHTVKAHDDGSPEIIKLIVKNKLDITNLKVTGVNTDACVIRTCLGLTRRSNMKVRIIKSACNSNGENPWKEVKKVLNNQITIGS